MIVLDNNGAVADWIRSQDLDVTGVTRIDVGTFELAKGLATELVVVEDIVYNQMDNILREKLNDVAAVILFLSSSIPITDYIPKIVFEAHYKTSKKILINQIQFLEDQIRQINIVKSQLISLNHDLIQLMGDVDFQLKRVKKTYELKAPKRIKEYKGLTLISKYAAGENEGGDFFDLYTSDSKIFIIMCTCSSYLVSNSIFQIFGDIKNKGIIDEGTELTLFNNLESEIQKINKSKKKPVQVELMTAIFDVSNLTLCGHQFGDFSMISSDLKQKVDNENTNLLKPELSYFSLQLSRGERIILNSPGFQKNWNITNAPFIIEEFVGDKNITALDLLDEIYFNLKKKSTDAGFLNYDASSVVLEVKQNVMLQI